MTIRRPSLFLVGSIIVLIVITILTGWQATTLPHFGLGLDSRPHRPLVVVSKTGDASDVHLPAAIIAWSRPDGSHRVAYETADFDLIRRVTGVLPPHALAVNDRALSAIQDGRIGVVLSGGDTRPIVFTASPNPLGAPFWMMVLAGFIAGAVGMWVVALRSDAVPAWAVAVSGLGLLAAAYPVAIILNGELLVGGSRWYALMSLNCIGIQVFAGGLAFLFVRYPLPLVRMPIAIGGSALLLAFAVVNALVEPDPARRFDRSMHIALVDLALIGTTATWQWVRTRRDPLARAYLRLVGSTSVLSCSAWLAITFNPTLISRDDVVTVPLSALLIMPIYITVAIGIVRGHMFAVNKWAARLMVSAATLLSIILLEAGLALALGVAARPGFSIAFVLVGTAWLLARHRLLDRLMGRDHAMSAELMLEAHAVVLAPTGKERARRWRDCIERTFRPLELDDFDMPVTATSIEDGGLELRVAAPSFGRPLMLRSSRGGRALFSREDVALVEQFRVLCDRVDADRRAYDESVRSERARIAKDLHDDVSGRLLTGLHRTDVEEVRQDVRTALGDIRSIVAGLEGNGLPLDAVIADLRCESGDRLAAAGMTLDWPIDPCTAQNVDLDYALYRTLVSVTRELVTNAIRHSGGKRLELLVRLTEDAVLVVTARDDGNGMAKGREGRGLRNIAARARERGGCAEFNNRGGLEVVVRLLLTPPQTGDASVARNAVAVK